jgi:hypothetical protein
MNSENSDQISHGTPDMCREVIHEVAGMASLQAELAMRYAELGDDTGLEYAVRRWTAYTRSAIATMADLKAMKAQKGGHEHGPR